MSMRAQRATTPPEALAAYPSTPHARQPRLAGSTTAHRPRSSSSQGSAGQCPPPGQRHAGAQVPHPRCRDVERCRHDQGGSAVEGSLRCRNVQPPEPDPLQGDWYGTEIVAADRWFPSSRACSACSVVNPALGREVKWSRPNRGVIHDRNENPARPPGAD